MRLTFNILWFEDTPSITDGIIEPVRDHLHEQGYSLNIVEILKDSTGLHEIIQSVNDKRLDVDLILMDYNLAGGEKGDKLIETIRRGELLTDIIFYSEHRGFRDKIGLLDGIYTTDRDELEEKTILVSDHILKKALDLPNLRGLVMSETSELEELMRQIILATLEEEVLFTPGKIRKDIKRRLQGSLKGNKKKIEQLIVEGEKPSNPHDFVELLDFDCKSRTLKKILEHYSKQRKRDTETDIDGVDLPYDSFDHERFQAQVIKNRNKLAHVKESVNQHGQKILGANKIGQEDFEFDAQKSVEIRKDLKRYYEILTAIYKAITGKQWEN